MPPPGPVLLSVRGLHADEGRAHALKGLDLDIAKEGVTAIFGPAGTGKSALLRTLSGRTRATAGSVRIAGNDIAGWRSDAVARHGVGYLPPTGGAFASLTVVENLRLSGRGSALARDRRVWLMRAFPDLAEAATRKASRLPRPLARLVAVARVLVAPRRLYLLDLPFADLPSGADTTLAGVLRDLRLQGATVVLTAAQPDAALEVASHAAVMADGSVRWAGDAEAFLADPTLASAAFGGSEAGT